MFPCMCDYVYIHVSLGALSRHERFDFPPVRYPLQGSLILAQPSTRSCCQEVGLQPTGAGLLNAPLMQHHPHAFGSYRYHHSRILTSPAKQKASWFVKSRGPRASPLHLLFFSRSPAEGQIQVPPGSLILARRQPHVQAPRSLVCSITKYKVNSGNSWNTGAQHARAKRMINCL